MGWKDWPYWLKGGVIGLLLGAMFSVFAIMSYNPTQKNYFLCPLLSGDGGPCRTTAIILTPFLFFSAIPLALFCWISGMEGSSCKIPEIVIVFSVLFVWILTGVLIGWIYGKIKNRNTKLTSSQ